MIEFTKVLGVAFGMGKRAFSGRLLRGLNNNHSHLKGQLQGHSAMLAARLLKILATLTALSAIAAPSAGTLQNLYTFFVRVSVLGAA